MVRVLQSQTFPINPPGAEPVLSIEQFWEVIKIKCRSPQLFIPAMASCSVLEENEKGLSREVIFKEGMGPPSGKVIEDLTFFKPWKVDFQGRGDNGSFISNIVSQGKDETDLYLTFYFEWFYPGIQEGSEEEEKTTQQMWEMSRAVVQETIDIARKFVKDGEIKV